MCFSRAATPCLMNLVKGGLLFRNTRKNGGLAYSTAAFLIFLFLPKHFWTEVIYSV